MDTPRRPLTLRELGGAVRTAAGMTFAAIAIPSAIILALGESKYAGASDEKTSSMIVDTYAAFLREVGERVLVVAVGEWLLLAVVVLGVLLLVLDHPRARALARTRAGRWGSSFALAELVVGSYVGYGAHRHPGLFLGPLSGSRLLAVAVEACPLFASAFALASLAGYAHAALRGTRSARASLAAAALALGLGAVLVSRRSATFRPAPFAVRDARPHAGAPAPAPVAAPPPRRFPNVLWIAVDSLRPDKIDPASTPNLAALVAESVYFPNAVVPVPRTGPSWAAALTSLSPITTGIETMFPDRARADLSAVALPAHLASQGYRTLVTSEYAGEFFGRVKLGFSRESVPRAELREISGQILLSRVPFVLSHVGLAYSTGPFARSLLPPVLGELVRGMPAFARPQVIADDVLAFVDEDGARERPTFALAFYSQPHFPYTSSAAFARPRVPGSSHTLAYGRDVANETPITTQADREQLDALYRAALAESDAAIGALLGGLRARGLLDDTLVVLSADHGEGLYECPECVGHGDNLRGMWTLRVPLAFRLPRARYAGAAPRVEQAFVSTLDVYPSLLELLGLPPIAIHEGASLVANDGGHRDAPDRGLAVETGEWLWTTAAVPKDRIAYPPITELARLDGDRIAIDPKFTGVIRAAKHRALLRPPYKLTYEPSKDGVRFRLYDFVADPLEAKDLSAERPDVTARMRDELRRSVLRHADVLPVGDFFLTRPPMPAEEHW